jgi:lipopolysaccharide export system permease protein
MIITRYICRQILQATAAITLVLMVVVVLGRMLNYLAQASQGQLDPDLLALVLTYRLPDFLQLILPLALLLGILLALGRLYADSEMTVLIATGMSQHRLLGITAVASVIVAILVGILSLVLAPGGSRKVSELLETQRNLSEFDLLVPGIFQIMSGAERTTYAERIDDGELQLVFMHDAVNDRVIMAESAVPIENEAGERFVVFRNGSMTEGLGGTEGFSVTRYPELGFRLPPRDLGITPDVEEKSMSTAELLADGTTPRLAEWQWRLSLIVLVPLLALLAVPLSRVSPRQGRFARLVPAILLYMTYLGLLLISRDAVAEATLPALPGMWLVHLLFAVLGILLFTGRLPWLGGRRG